MAARQMIVEPQSASAASIDWRHVIAAALLLTGLNAIKPIHADDPAYLRYGAEFRAHPLNPYSFEFGTPSATAGNDMLVPPVVAYWFAAGTAFFGDNPFLLKLTLFPFALLLAWAADVLAGRFAPNLRRPLLWMIVISPSILPAFNCMLDVPVLALSLTAIAVATLAIDRDRWMLTLVAGSIAGIAVQTKYTGLVTVGAVGVWFFLHGRWMRGVAAVSVAITLAVGWEVFIATVHGESHFLIHFRQRQGGLLVRVVRLILPLLSHVAGLGAAVALLGFAAIGWNGRKVLLAGLAMAACFAALALIPSQEALIAGADGKPILTPSNIIYGLLAIVVWSGIVRACVQLAFRNANASEDRRLDWFLLAWIVLEFGGYFALSPFPAARRVAGLLVVFALLVGRLASLRGVAPRTAAPMVGCGMALGLLIFVADYYDTRWGEIAAPAVAHGPHQPPQDGKFWHCSWMGFGYYAERAGLEPLQLNRHLPRPGDLVAIDSLTRQYVPSLPKIELEWIDTYEATDRFPLKATPGYCNGRTPLEHCGGSRMKILIYRITSVAEAETARGD